MVKRVNYIIKWSKDHYIMIRVNPQEDITIVYIMPPTLDHLVKQILTEIKKT